MRYDIKDYIVEARYHTCAVCEKSVLQDLQLVMSHVRNHHNMSAQEYREGKWWCICIFHKYRLTHHGNPWLG